MRTGNVKHKVVALSIFAILFSHSHCYSQDTNLYSKFALGDVGAVVQGQTNRVHSVIGTQTLKLGTKLIKVMGTSIEGGLNQLVLISASTSAYAMHRERTNGRSILARNGALNTLQSTNSKTLFGSKRIKFGHISGTSRIARLMKASVGAKSDVMCQDKCSKLASDLGPMASDTKSKLGIVSRAINHIISYEKDDLYQSNRDYWSTATETLLRGKGDCEDYAILKMAVLSRIGIPLSAMEIAVVKDKRRNLFHAVLSVSLNDKNYILDNLTDKIEVDVEISNYQPMYSVSQQATYIYGKKVHASNKIASVGANQSLSPGNGF